MHQCLSLFAAFLLWLPQGGTVSGRILDRDGKPLMTARITYTHVGQLTQAGSTAYMAVQPSTIGAGTGKVYQTKPNKKGEFQIVKVPSGIYRVEIADASGAFLYSARQYVGDDSDVTWSNVLNVNLSAPPADAVPRQSDPAVTKINTLTKEARTALDNREWDRAADLLQQLIALDPNRWQAYQNLGSIQGNAGEYKKAAENFQKAIEIAQKSLANTPDSAKLKADISGMMVAEADALNRLDRLDDATALYKQAAELAPEPAMAYFHACNAQSNRGTSDVAIDFCTKAIAADLNHWEFYQVMAGAQNTSGKPDDAIQTYDKGIQAARRELATKPESELVKNGLGQLLNAEGNIYAQQNKIDRAISAFAEAATLAAYAALPYFNLCAMYYDAKRLDEAVKACDHSIASDPTMSEAYYIKAASLFGKGNLTAGKYTPPEEARAALNKYLELAPFGQHAQLVREMIDKLNEAIDTGSPSNPVKK